MLRKDSEDKADYNDCRNLSALASFFRIQWRKPKLAAFTAAKKLAAMDQNATYIFDNTNRMTHRSAFEEYLQRTEEQIQQKANPQPYRKTDSIENRLIAYHSKASIG